MGSTEGSPYRRRSCFPDLPTKTSSRPEPRSHSSVISVVFFFAGARCLSAGHHLRLTRGPAGNRTTTGSRSVISVVQLHSCTQPASSARLPNSMAREVAGHYHLLCSWCHCPYCCNCTNRVWLPQWRAERGLCG